VFARLTKPIAIPTPVAMMYNTARKSKTQLHDLHHLATFHPLVSGLGGAELTLSLLLPDLDPSSALLSRKPVQRSASDSLLGGGSVKNSEDKEGVLGVRWKGDTGRRRLIFEAPGLARPACSFCSSVQFSRAAIN
jgi:hypothetical protein